VVINIINSVMVMAAGFTITNGNRTTNNGESDGLHVRQATASIIELGG